MKRKRYTPSAHTTEAQAWCDKNGLRYVNHYYDADNNSLAIAARKQGHYASIHTVSLG